MRTNAKQILVENYKEGNNENLTLREYIECEAENDPTFFNWLFEDCETDNDKVRDANINEWRGFIESIKDYEVQVRFEGSDGWEKICTCYTRYEALDEIEYQKKIEDNSDCEYRIVER